MAPLTLLLHSWSHTGDMWFPFFPGFFNPGFFWICVFLLFILWKRHGHHGHHRGHGHGKGTPAPNPTTPRQRKGDGGQAWPNLYPDDPSRAPQVPLEPKGKVEYF